MKKNSDNSDFKKHFEDFNFTSLEKGLAANIEFFIKNYNSLRK